MRLVIAAVGRLGPGPEASMVEDYRARAESTGRALALAPVSIAQIDERKARTADAQAERLIAATPAGAALVALDERGQSLSSQDLAALIADLRDAGRPALVFAIGGADGHGVALGARAERRLAFGPMVWPHRLVRVMMAEQIYRAVSILAGTPYHRG